MRLGRVAQAWDLINPSNGKAYFFGGPSGAMSQEFTHQVLYALTGRNRSPSWLIEGTAVYAQSVTFDLRGASFPGAPKDESWSVDEMLALRNHDDWNR